MRKRQQQRKRQQTREYQQMRRRQRDEREACERDVRMLCEQLASCEREMAQIVLRADARGDWQDAGYSSSEEWLAQVLAGNFGNGPTRNPVEPVLAPPD